MSEELLEIRKLILRLNKLAKKEKFFDFSIQFQPLFKNFCVSIGSVMGKITKDNLNDLILRRSIPISLATSPEQVLALSEAIRNIMKIRKGNFWISTGHVSRLGERLIRFLTGKKDVQETIEALFEYLKKLQVF